MKVVVIDNGSAVCKAGIAGANDPSAVFPTVVGQLSSEGQTEIVVGDDAQLHKDNLALKSPIERGVITNWDDIEKLWQYTFQKRLKVEPTESAVLLTESATNSEKNRAKMAQIMFESFRTPAMYVAKSQVLTLYAAGRKDGIVVESGAGVTHVVPVIEGFAVSNAVLHQDLAGKGLTDYLMQLLNEKGYAVSKDDIVSDIKKTICYVASDFEHESNTAASGNSLERSYELPDGKFVTIGRERFLCPEAFFQPSLCGLKCDGISQIICNSASKCDKKMHEVLYSNIVLGGGSTMFSGLAERMEKGVKNLASPSTKVKVIAPPGRIYSSWIGGSILGSLDAFQSMWVTKQEYEETGASIVHKKCV